MVFISLFISVIGVQQTNFFFLSLCLRCVLVLHAGRSGKRGGEAKFSFNYLNSLGSNNKCDRETGKFEGNDLQLFTPLSYC